MVAVFELILPVLMPNFKIPKAIPKITEIEKEKSHVK